MLPPKYSKLKTAVPWQKVHWRFSLFDSVQKHCPNTRTSSIFPHCRLPNKIQVNNMLQPWRQANRVDQRNLLPHLKKTLSFLKKKKKPHSQRQLILETLLKDGNTSSRDGFQDKCSPEQVNIVSYWGLEIVTQTSEQWAFVFSMTGFASFMQKKPY